MGDEVYYALSNEPKMNSVRS